MPSYRTGPQGPVARHLRGVVAHGRSTMQRHGYRGVYGQRSAPLGGYGSLIGAPHPAGGVTLARITPKAAFGDVGAQYEGRAPLHGVYGKSEPTSTTWSASDPKAQQIAAQSSSGGSGFNVQQWADIFQFGLQTAQQLGVQIPGPATPGINPNAGGTLPPASGAGPSTSGYNVGTTTVVPEPPSTPRKKLSGWALLGIVAGTALLVGGATYASSRASD